jgi:Fe-S-cluster containining protein
LSNWKTTSKKRKRSTTQARAHVHPLPVAKSAAGRVHLVLHRDAQGRASAASLNAPLFSLDWQNTLTASAANTALSTLGQTPQPNDVANLARDAMNALSKFSSGVMTQTDAPKVACAAGCAHCCHQPVGLTPIEAIAMLYYLQATCSPEELQAVTQRVHTERERIEGLSKQERYSPDHPCPLLRDNQCTVYPARPLTCRATNSLDANVCATNLHSAAARAEFMRTGKGPDSLLGPYRASHALSAGLQMCLSEVYGLDMQPLDLTRALDELLQRPELATEWLRTGRGLEAARGGDGSDDKRLLHIAGVHNV